MCLCLHKINPSTFERVFVCDGKAIVFDPNGVYKGENNTIIPDATFSMVDMISILQMPNGAELACSINGVFYKYATKVRGSDMVSTYMNGEYKPKFVGTRELVIHGVHLMQYFLMFPCTFLTAQKVEQTLNILLRNCVD